MAAKIEFQSQPPYTTWFLSVVVEQAESESVIPFLKELDAAGWNKLDGVEIPNEPTEMKVFAPGSREDGSWGDGEAQKFMGRARHILAQHGFKTVHKRKLAKPRVEAPEGH